MTHALMMSLHRVHQRPLLPLFGNNLALEAAFIHCALVYIIQCVYWSHSHWHRIAVRALHLQTDLKGSF